MSGPRDRYDVRRLYDVHGRALLAYACALLHDPSEAEDVVHQVFLQLLRDGGTEISSPGYLFRAVRNRVLNHLRGRSREVALDVETQWLESPSGSIETALALQSALGALMPYALDDSRDIESMFTYTSRRILPDVERSTGALGALAQE